MRERTTSQFRKRLSRRFGARGAAMVEYGLLLFIAAPVITGITAGGMRLFNQYTTVRAAIVNPLP